MLALAGPGQGHRLGCSLLLPGHCLRVGTGRGRGSGHGRELSTAKADPTQPF
ncbi:hypothetical protein CyaNS01_01550 [Cyanobium sp. NS01]|nr:hypothetical protein CyaNS01_01550 [Cyanobium sp. NS01]